MRSHRAGHYSSMDETLAMLALGGGGAGSGSSYTFVLRPGGTTDRNVFTTWAALYAATQLVLGPVLIEVDSSIAPATVPAGTYNFPDGVLFQGHDFFSQLDFATGAFLVSEFLVIQSITFHNDGATSPYSPTATSEMLVYDAVIESGAGAAPWMHVTVTTVVSALVIDGFSFIGDGVHAAITVDAGQVLTMTLIGSSVISAGTIVGAGSVGLQISPSSFIGAQPGVGSVTALTAGQNLVSTTNTGGPIGPLGTVTLSAASGLVRERGGRVRVSGSIGVTSAGVGGGTITFTLLRDAVTLLTRTVSPDAGGHAGADLEVFDTLTDFASHAYAIQAAASAGTVTIPTDSGNISAQEV